MSSVPYLQRVSTTANFRSTRVPAHISPRVQIPHDYNILPPRTRLRADVDQYGFSTSTFARRSNKRQWPRVFKVCREGGARTHPRIPLRQPGGRSPLRDGLAPLAWEGEGGWERFPLRRRTPAVAQESQPWCRPPAAAHTGLSVARKREIHKQTNRCTYRRTVRQIFLSFWLRVMVCGARGSG